MYFVTLEKIGDFPHHCYLLLQLFNDTHANLKWDLKTLLKQNQIHVTQSLIQGWTTSFRILNIIYPPVQSQNTRSETQEQRKWLSVQKCLQYVILFSSNISIISNIILNLMKSDRCQFLTQIESNHWECGDRIIWVGSVGLDFDQDSLSESKQEMN